MNNFTMKNMTLSLLAAAAMGTISIGSVSAMPVNNLAGLGESHFQDVRLVCDRFGRCYNTRRAYRSYPYARRYYGVLASIPAMVLATILAMVLATDITADRVSELVSARSASVFGNPQSSCNDLTLDPPG